MYKRNILKTAIATFLIIILTAAGAFADAYNEDDAKAMLSALGIYNQTETITKKDFVLSLMGFVFEKEQIVGKAEEYAKTYGMIGVGETFNEGEQISTAEAARYAVGLLGYNTKAESYGGYPEGYIRTASELKITTGIAVDEKTKLNQSDYTKILYKMLDAEPMGVTFKDSAAGAMKVRKGETLLSIYRDIYKINGLQTADENTSLYSESGEGDGYIAVDDTRYAISDNITDTFIGRNVTVFYKEDNGNYPQIMSITQRASKNDIITVDAEDIQNIADDFSVIEYENEKSNIKKLKIDSVPKVIYNGVFYGAYTKADLMPDEGNLCLIDNNSDGKYDVIIVTSYEIVVNENVDKSDYIIYNKYKFEGCSSSINIKDAVENEKILIYKNGVRIELNDIKQGDILAVATSKNTSGQIVSIYVSSESVSGTVTRIDSDENEIDIGGTTYKTDNAFRGYIEKGNKELKTQNEYIIYLDAFNKAAYFKSVMDNAYVMLYRVYEDYDADRYYAQYMDLNGEWRTSDLAKKVKVDDVSYTPAAAYESALQGISPQVVKLKENSKGEIKSIDFAEISQNENIFTKTAENNLIYRAGPKCFDLSIYLEDDAKVFIIPKNKKEKEGYYVINSAGNFKADARYTITAYDLDKYGFTHLLSMNENDDWTSVNTSSTLFLVTKKIVKLVDDEVLPAITGNYGDFCNITVVGKNSNTFDNVKKGDIVNVHLGSSGKVDYVKKLYSAADDFKTQNLGDRYIDQANLAGRISEIDAGEFKMQLDFGDEKATYKLTNNVAVQTYIKSDNECEPGDIYDLKVGDKVFCRTSYGEVYEIIIIKERI